MTWKTIKEAEKDKVLFFSGRDYDGSEGLAVVAVGMPQIHMWLWFS